MAASALRRSFNARRDSSNDSISASMACCKRSREFAWVAFMEKLVVWCKDWGYNFRTPFLNQSVIDLPDQRLRHTNMTLITPKKRTTKLMSMGRHFTGVECSYVRTLETVCLSLIYPFGGPHHSFSTDCPIVKLLYIVNVSRTESECMHVASPDARVPNVQSQGLAVAQWNPSVIGRGYDGNVVIVVAQRLEIYACRSQTQNRSMWFLVLLRSR